MDKVVLEYINNENPEEVAVMFYDEEYKEIGELLEVTSHSDAVSKYKIVGMVNDGRLRLFGKDDEDDFY